MDVLMLPSIEIIEDIELESWRLAELAFDRFHVDGTPTSWDVYRRACELHNIDATIIDKLYAETLELVKG